MNPLSGTAVLRARRVVMLVTAIGASTLAMPASGQELVHQFTDPGFGGNPFNADYLLGTATPQRPDRPSTPGQEPLTEAELFARQLQSRLLSALSSSLVETITGADPGTSGEFTVGDQTIFFERTLTEIRLTITDNGTGETTEIVVPVLTVSTEGNQTGQSATLPPIAGLTAATQAPSALSPLSGGSSLFSPPPLEGSSLGAGDLVATPALGH